jgi:ABC-type sugar transport system ATPase subunit
MSAGIVCGPVALSARAVGKIYPPANVALRGVDLELGRGQVHGLLGANGAGKSTLIKILCGIERPTSGGIWMEGHGDVQFAGPQDAERAGIGVVHQELPLLPNLTAAENMVLGQRSGGFLSGRRRRAVEQEYRRRAEMFPGAPPADALLSRVGLHGWQMTAIIRARYLGSRVVILDEPTSSLDAAERRVLHDNLRRMAHDGTAILYVSHFLEDILDVCDTVTVLRDGRIALEQSTSGLSERDLLLAMTGDATAADTVLVASQDSVPPNRQGLAVRGLRCGGVGPLDVTVALGERVGVYGLEGSGSREALEAIFGLLPHAGEITWRGRPLRGAAGERIAAGIGFVSGDRARTLIGAWSVARNHGLPALANRSRVATLHPADEVRSARSTIRRLAVKGEATEPLRSLSGGNQQKVAVGRWLERFGICLLAADPTRGVDVRGRRAIHQTLIDFCHQGNALLVHSADPEELVELCDRVLVMAAGRIVASLHGTSLNGHELEAATRIRTRPTLAGDA